MRRSCPRSPPSTSACSESLRGPTSKPGSTGARRADIEARLGRRCGQYHAVLSAPKACVNSALVVEHAIAHLANAHPDRFRLADHTMVDRIVLGEGSAVLEAGGNRVECGHVVLCTNGYIDHTVLDVE